MPAYTPTQHLILQILSDGQRHHSKEIRGEIDEFMDGGALRVHMHKLRKKLRPMGEEILCEFFNGRLYYRHVRLISIQ